MTIKEIIFHLNNVFEGTPWYGKSILDILNRINSFDGEIRDIVTHMLAWRAFVLRKIQGEDCILEVDSEEDWPKESSMTLKEAIEILRSSNRAIIMEIQSKPKEWLRKKAQSSPYNFQFLLEGIIQHDIYHLGQVALLMKNQSKFRKIDSIPNE